MGWPDTVVKLCGRAGERGASISADGFAGLSSRMRAAFAQHFGHGGKLCRSRRTHISILGPVRRGEKLSTARLVSGPLAEQRLADIVGRLAGGARSQIREHVRGLPIVSVVVLINGAVRC